MTYISQSKAFLEKLSKATPEELKQIKKKVYSDVDNLTASHYNGWIKECLKYLALLPKEKRGVTLLVNLHKKIDHPYLRTIIENDIEAYPEELLENCPIRKVKVENCMSIEEDTVYYCTFNLNKGFFVEKMQKLGASRQHSERCFSNVLYYIRDLVMEETNIRNDTSCSEQINYKVNSEEKREMVKSCLSRIQSRIDIDDLCAKLANCHEERIDKFFEYYDLLKRTEQKVPSAGSAKRPKI